MKISQNDWIRYREMMSKISRKAAEEFDIRFRGRINTVERKEVIDYAMALVEKYSEASSELACQMYERIAALSGVDIPPAEPAKTAEYGEVAKGINGTLKQSPEGKLCGDVVNRLVKRAGADTMLKNAERDRAQFAWVPHGDTCSFCIMLASRGWQNISKKVWKNGHAEHIHAHCDCQYCVRFNQNTEVEGYDPDQYLEMYENAEGNKWRDKLNAMRREDRNPTEQFRKSFMGIQVGNDSTTRSIPKSIGARFFNNSIVDFDTGMEYHIGGDGRVLKVKTFAGKDSKNEYRKAYKYSDKYGGAPEEWKHMKGEAYIENEYESGYAEIHWSEHEIYGAYDPFVKKWL